MSAQQSQLDFYLSIPKFSEILLKVGSDMELRITPDYRVTLSSSYRGDKYSAHLSASGNLTWDSQNDRMAISLSGSVSGSGSYSEAQYRTERKYNVGSGTLNFLFGEGTAETYSYEKVYDGTKYFRTRGSSSFTYQSPLYLSDDGKYGGVDAASFSVYLRGDYSRDVNFRVVHEVNKFKYGEGTASNNVTNDEFGRWQWNSSRTSFWLKSLTSNPTVELRIDLLPTNTFELQFVFPVSVSGKNKQYADSTTIHQFEIRFMETGNEATLPFVYSQDDSSNAVYKNAKYNRFLEQWDYNASPIVSQLKTEQTLVLNYVLNGETSASIFKLEGLETILNYLQQ